MLFRSARFRKQTEDGDEFNWVEFHKFCQEHPQLVRRLRDGISRDTLHAKKQQFTCETPEAVVQVYSARAVSWRVATSPAARSGTFRYRTSRPTARISRRLRP